MTHVLRIAHLRIALHVANPEVGKREGIHSLSGLFIQSHQRSPNCLIYVHNFAKASIQNYLIT